MKMRTLGACQLEMHHFMDREIYGLLERKRPPKR
jgi:hypothetical protein